MDKRGQVTIFVILGIVIALGIVVYFLLGGVKTTGPVGDFGPKSIVTGCVDDEVEDAVDEIILKGGVMAWNKAGYQTERQV